MEASISPRMVAFEGFRFDVDLRRLLRPDATGVWAPAAVGVRALDVLAVLLRQPGALVTKDVIMQQVWPGTAVEANNLTVQITALRKVLDGGRPSESCIQTVAGRGYRFVAFITRPSDESPNFPGNVSGTISGRTGQPSAVSANLDLSKPPRKIAESSPEEVLAEALRDRRTPAATGRAEVDEGQPGGTSSRAPAAHGHGLRSGWFGGGLEPA